MFKEFRSTIVAANFKVKNQKGNIRRTCELTFETDLTEDIARAIDKKAKGWRADLKSGAMSKINIPISAIACVVDMHPCGGEDQPHQIPMARGIEAIATSADDEEFDPRIKIKIGFRLRREDAAWIPMQLGNVIDVTMKKAQLSLVVSDMALN